MNLHPRPITCIIVDDEEHGRTTLRYALEEHPQWQLLHECDQAESARAYLSANKVDVVFLDIQMPKENGISLARSISALPSPPLIIFVTAYNNHALDAFAVHALDYVLKPCNPKRLADTLRHAQDMLEQKHGYAVALQHALASLEHSKANPNNPTPELNQLIVRSVGAMESIALADILWFSSASNYVELHLAKRSVLHRMTLSDLEQRLPSHSFLRTHRTAIVRISQIKQLSILKDGSYQLQLHCGDKVPVSERYLEQVRAHFNS